MIDRLLIIIKNCQKSEKNYLFFVANLPEKIREIFSDDSPNMMDDPPNTSEDPKKSFIVQAPVNVDTWIAHPRCIAVTKLEHFSFVRTCRGSTVPI